MAETGFGSLSYNPLPEYNDWGFGSPSPVQLGVLNDESSSTLGQESATELNYEDRAIDLERDTGFGSPFDNFRHPVQLPGEFDLIPDDGGVLLKINSKWADAWDFSLTPRYRRGSGALGPFFITYISQATGTQYTGIGSYQGVRCFTNSAQNVLYVGVQPLPHGTYDLVVRWQGVQTLRIVNAFTVGLRPRIPEAYNIRNHIPGHMQRGPNTIKSEEIIPYNGESNLSLVLKSIAETIQVMSGRPTTALTQPLAYNDSEAVVESTIGFPDSGVLIIGGFRVSYSGKSVDRFTGLSTSSYWPNSFSKREEVTCDVAAIK